MDPATLQVIEQLGLELEADGLPRSAGRILGRLLLSGEARTLDQLADELRMSKANASSNARLLERAGAIERTSVPGDRRDFYRVSPRLHVRLLGRRMDRLGALLAVLEGARRTVPAGDPEIRRRLDTFAGFFGEMLEVVRDARNRWESEHDCPGDLREGAAD